jgi:hypothetical protein
VDDIVRAVDAGERGELRGFGSFFPRERKSRRGRNPKTGESLAVPAKRIMFFKAGKDLLARFTRRSKCTSRSLQMVHGLYFFFSIICNIRISWMLSLILSYHSLVKYPYDSSWEQYKSQNKFLLPLSFTLLFFNQTLLSFYSTNIRGIFRKI